MKRNRKSIHLTSLLAATILVFGLSQNTALAQKAGPLAEILERLDAFVTELEGIDVQTEELENPSFEDKIKDAIGLELCGQWTFLEGELELTLLKFEGEAEFGLGLGPNFMGTGLKVTLEPKLDAAIALESHTQASIQTETCVNILNLAEIIKDQEKAAEAGTASMPAALDLSPDPLELFVKNLEGPAKIQILELADQSTVYLLELVVMLMQRAGINPEFPDSLANSLLKPVDVMYDYAMDLSPEGILDVNRASEIVEYIPFGAGLKTSFTGGVAALSSFSIDDIDPCGDAQFLPGLEDLHNAVCGFGSLYTDSAGYLEELGGALVTTDAINKLVPSVETEFIGMKDDLDSLLGDMGMMFDDIKTKVCQTFKPLQVEKSILVAKAWASVSFNPCNLSSISIKLGLKAL